MAGFMYFFPGAQSSDVTPEFIQQRGLGQPFRSLFRSWAPNHTVALWNITGSGPGGESGVVVYPVLESGNLPQVAGYCALTQEWTHHGGFWLGYDKKLKPKPDDLALSSLVGGAEWMLGDGSHWLCPIIRAPKGVNNLPQTWSVNGTGEVIERTVDEYLWAWDLAGRCWDILSGKEKLPENEDTKIIFQLCSSLLSVNYRVGIHECGALGLIGSHNWNQIIQIAVFGDLKGLAENEDEKKSPQREPTSNTSPGDEEPTPATSQPVTNST